MSVSLGQVLRLLQRAPQASRAIHCRVRTWTHVPRLCAAYEWKGHGHITDRWRYERYRYGPPDGPRRPGDPGEDVVEARGTLWFRRPRTLRLRLEYGSEPWEWLVDGDRWWELAGGVQLRVSSRLGDVFDAPLLELLDPSHQLALLNLEVENDEGEAIVLRGTQRNPVLYPRADIHRLWVHAERGVLLRRVLINGGEEFRREELLDVRFDHDPPEAVFTPPSGAEVVNLNEEDRMLVGVPLWKASRYTSVAILTPAVFEDQPLLVVNPDGSISLHYSGADLEIIEQRMDGEPPPAISEHRFHNGDPWRELVSVQHGTRVTIRSTESVERIMEIAASLRPADLKRPRLVPRSE